MPRTTRKNMLAERNDASAPYLFDEEQMPVRLAVLQSVKSKSYEHTGARLLDDDADALLLVEKIVLGWGVAKIAREMHISKCTVRAARRELSAQGKLDSYKQRVVEIFEDIVVTGSSNYRDALEKGAVPAAQIPIGVAIFHDKRALMLGEPTSIVGKSGKDDALSEETLNGFLDRLKPAQVIDLAAADSPQKEAVTDLESPALPAKTK